MLDCYCMKMMYSGIFDLNKENIFMFLNFILIFFYLCLLGVGVEGVEGFFKGIGKGFFGLLVYLIGGVVDMVSFIFDGVRRLNFLYLILYYIIMWFINFLINWLIDWMINGGVDGLIYW